MAEKKVEAKTVSMTNTKQEMLNAYNTLLEELEKKDKTELKPEKKMEEKKMKEVVKVADSLSSEGAVKEISNLKLEIGKTLAGISDNLEEEVNKYRGIREAIEIKENELKEIYEIEKSSATLAALIEANHQKRQEFESEMDDRKKELHREIQSIRAEWEKEKKDYEAKTKEQEAAETKKREREKEEYRYSFNREQQLVKDKFEDEKEKLKNEIQFKKEQMEKELAERENAVSEREDELNELKKKAGAFPKEMEAAVNKAIKETTEAIQREAKNKEDLLKKEVEGERNVFTSRIENLAKMVEEQREQITILSEKLEKAYQKVQDVAVKAIEGSSNFQSFAAFQQLSAEQTRKLSQEK